MINVKWSNYWTAVLIGLALLAMLLVFVYALPAAAQRTRDSFHDIRVRPQTTTVTDENGTTHEVELEVDIKENGNGRVTGEFRVDGSALTQHGRADRVEALYFDENGNFEAVVLGGLLDDGETTFNLTGRVPSAEPNNVVVVITIPTTGSHIESEPLDGRIDLDYSHPTR